MTYEEMIEIGDAVFDEYAPKLSSRTRRSVLDGILDELKVAGVLEVEDAPVEPSTEDELGF